MEKYLTEKANPKSAATRLESGAGLLLFLLIGALGVVAVYGFLQDGFQPVAHLLIVAMLAGLILLMKWITDRKRARVHARVIVSALCRSEGGCIPYEQMMKDTGINRLEDVIAGLTRQGYIRQIAVVGQDVCLMDQRVDTIQA